jgi:hypothetical protein
MAFIIRTAKVKAGPDESALRIGITWNTNTNITYTKIQQEVLGIINHLLSFDAT